MESKYVCVFLAKKKKTDVDYHKISTAVLAEWKYFSKEI